MLVFATDSPCQSGVWKTTVVGLGVGQNWYDVSASRAGGVLYTNTTSQPIFLTGRAGAGGAGFFVNGIAAAYAGAWAGFSVIVPAGQTYITPNVISMWYELR
jgi:hypothetical protein